jgi:hypothetical protein
VADRPASTLPLDPALGVNRHADWAAIAQELQGLNAITAEGPRRARS